MSAKGLVATLALVLALLASSLAALPDLGIAWDEGLGDLFFGHRNLEALRGDASALDFTRHHPSDGDGRSHPDLFLSPLRDRPWEHFPVMASLSALLCEALPAMDPIEAHHLAGVLALALLLPFYVSAAERAWGLPAAIVAALSLLLHPRLLAAAWVDLKDIGAAVFGSIALLLLWRGFESGRSRFVLAAAVAVGLALGTKLNVLFLPLPVFAFLALARGGRPRLGRRGLGALLLVPVIAAGVVFALWPWLRADPLVHAANSLGYVFGRGAASNLWPNPWPAVTFLLSWPLGTLPLVAWGAFAGARDLAAHRATLAGFALLAVLFPLARLSAPGVLSFDGFRHGLELLPPAALLAGAGALRLLAARRRVAAQALLIGLLVEPVAEIYAAHPFALAHMSPLVGGSTGARRLGVPGVEDYWATSYRRAYGWIDAHAEHGASVAAGVAEHLLFLEGPLRLRGDLRLLRASNPFAPDPGPEVTAAFLAEARVRPIYLVYIRRREWYGPIVQEAERREAVWSEGPVADPLVRIVRFGPEPADRGR